MAKSISILIPSVEERADKLSRLVSELSNQIRLIDINHPTLGTVELIIDNSKPFSEGGMSIGQKRDSLLRRSEAEYVCFLDDDDIPAPNYVESLLRASQHGYDVITFDTLFKNDYYWTIISMKLGNPNEESTPIYPVKRNAWHTCLIKRGIAQAHSFESLNHNEDWTWMENVIKDINTSFHIPMILNQYNHSESESIADKIHGHHS